MTFSLQVTRGNVTAEVGRAMKQGGKGPRFTKNVCPSLQRIDFYFQY